MAVESETTVSHVVITRPKQRLHYWFRERYYLSTGFFVFCTAVFTVLGFATTLSGVTYLSGNALLKFGIAWWVVLGFTSILAGLFYFLDIRQFFPVGKTLKRESQWSEIDRYDRHMAFWLPFIIVLFGAINIGVYYGKHGSVNVGGDAIALVDYKITFTVIASSFFILVVVISRWGFHVRNPMVSVEASLPHAEAALSLVNANQGAVNAHHLPGEPVYHEISIRTRAANDRIVHSTLYSKLLGLETPWQWKGFYWTALIQSFVALIGFGLMWTNTLSGVQYLAGNGARGWLIGYSVAVGFFWLLNFIFYMICLFSRLQLSLRVHTEMQAYFWGMTFAILIVFGGLLTYDLQIGSFNINANPSTYLNFKLIQVVGAAYFLFTFWITTRLALLPAETHYLLITEPELQYIASATIDPNEARGGAQQQAVH